MIDITTAPIKELEIERDKCFAAGSPGLGEVFAEAVKTRLALKKSRVRKKNSGLYKRFGIEHLNGTIKS